MHFPQYILASDSGLVKFGIFVIFLVLWGISALASAVKKANEQAKKRAAVRPPVPVVPQAIPRAVAKPQLSHRRSAPPPARPAPAPFVPQSSRVPAPISALAPTPPPMPKPAAARATATAASAGTRAAGRVTGAAAPPAVKLLPHGATPLAIRLWLRPASLRKQFILTELLQPPIALRGQPQE